MRGGVILRFVVVCLLLALVAGAVFAWRDYTRFVATPLLESQDTAAFTVPRGARFRDVVTRLQDQGRTRASLWYWRALGEEMGVTRGLHAGEYALEPGMRPREVLQMLADGRVVQHRFTIVEGWTFAQLRRALAEVPTLRHELAELDDAALMERIGAGGEHPEGRFLPETYAYVRDTTDTELLRRAHRALEDTLAGAWEGRAADLPLRSPYEVLILASIIEKETAQPDERTRIAGVFTRRLRIGMALATDPTVIYGMGSRFDGNLRRRDLRADTPYNTYLRAGLPPTPIALAGRAAIEAAVHPLPGKELYFVARGDGSGRHEFSATLAEHNRAVACHQLKRCRQ